MACAYGLLEVPPRQILWEWLAIITHRRSKKSRWNGSELGGETLELIYNGQDFTLAIDGSQ